MADSYRKQLEDLARAQNDTPRGRAVRAEVERRIAEYNASLSYNRMKDKPYLIPGDFNSGGWVYPSKPKEFFVTVPTNLANPKNAGDLAEFIAHEGMHSWRHQSGMSGEKRPAKLYPSDVGPGEPVERASYRHPDAINLATLRTLLERQKTFDVPLNYFPPEETYATYAGIEGRLPKGTAITSRPEFAELNTNQALKDLLFSETGGGIWEGQSQPPRSKLPPPPKPSALSEILGMLKGELGQKQSLAGKVLELLTR